MRDAKNSQPKRKPKTDPLVEAVESLTKRIVALEAQGSLDKSFILRLDQLEEAFHTHIKSHMNTED